MFRRFMMKKSCSGRFQIQFVPKNIENLLFGKKVSVSRKKHVPKTYKFTDHFFQIADKSEFCRSKGVAVVHGDRENERKDEKPMPGRVVVDEVEKVNATLC